MKKRWGVILMLTLVLLWQTPRVFAQPEKEPVSDSESLKNLDDAEQNRQIDDLVRKLENAEDQIDRLEDRIQRLEYTVNDLRRKVT